MRWFCGIFVIVVFLVGCASRQADSIMGDKKVEVAETAKYSGGKGDGPEDAVVITGVHKQTEGVVAEYDYISTLHGEKNKNWSLYGQSIIKEKDKIFDVIEIKLIDFNGEKRIYYFDVSSFPWKKND
jgi:hypothetical protein